jgi:Tol biopolymer transport system component
MVAYIDLQSATLHTIRSDGLEDTVIKQPLLKHGVSPSSVWDTQTGMAILDSLTWSSDGSLLAFIADPAGTGLTNLYIYSKETGAVQMVALPSKGSVSNPIWSPDGVRLAFELTHNGTVSILDYNTQNRGLLTIADSIASQGNPGDSILTLDWSPDVNMPAITWSVGTIGHVHSIWVRRVGAAGTVASLLMSGDYVQAIYSRNGHSGEGSWLLVSSIIGRPGDLWRVDAIPGARLVSLTSGRQIGFAWWSPDGTS